METFYLDVDDGQLIMCSLHVQGWWHIKCAIQSSEKHVPRIHMIKSTLFDRLWVTNNRDGVARNIKTSTVAHRFAIAAILFLISVDNKSGKCHWWHCNQKKMSVAYPKQYRQVGRMGDDIMDPGKQERLPRRRVQHGKKDKWMERIP